MLIILFFLRLQFFPLKIILFFHKYRETIFCDIISVKKPAIIEIMSFGQSHGQTPLENVLFMALFKTFGNCQNFNFLFLQCLFSIQNN